MEFKIGDLVYIPADVTAVDINEQTYEVTIVAAMFGHKLSIRNVPVEFITSWRNLANRKGEE